MPLLCDLLEFLTAGRRHLALAARLIGLMSTAVASALPSLAAERVLDARMHHLRSGPEREWAEFPAVAEAAELRLTFSAEANATLHTLRLSHRDVKQTWRVRLNDRELGKLPPDETPMTTFWEVPAGTLRAGDNTLLVSAIPPASGKPADDILLGDVRLIDRPRADALNDGKMSVSITDAATGQPLPGRITVVDDRGFLFTVGAESGGRLAVRPGVVYTGDGRAEFRLPAGKYTLYAGRGFEYSIDSKAIEVTAGQRQEYRLSIRREVPMPGYVNCDTHVHTWTYSRHGDATLQERLVTVAAEGLELPIATDHNLQIDIGPAAREAGLRQHFTPVVGNELTTRVGHFNVFPLNPAGPVIDHQGRDWDQVFTAIGTSVPPRVVVFNHPRDVHAGFRPFDPARHISLSGEGLDGWQLRANAMELVNSGALQTDPWRLVHDWLGLLNAGLRIAPVGASDSHDVARSILAHARTYIRCRDDDPGKIDAAEAVSGFAAGRVLVSFGLVADVKVNGQFAPGDLATISKEAEIGVEAQVFGPSWSRASEVVLFVNGVEMRREPVPAAGAATGGLKFKHAWKLPRPKHDAHLAVVAIGPGVAGLYWPTPKPYQPASPDWRPYSLGVTGAVWLDADGKPGFTSAREHAEKLIADAPGDMMHLGRKLGEFDDAVAIQAAAALRRDGRLFSDASLDTLLTHSQPSTQAAIRRYVAAWKESEAARSTK